MPVASLLVIFSLAVALAACGGESGESSGAPAPADAEADKLAEILARGTLIVSTDPEYPPQSFAVEGTERPADTKCEANQLTAAELAGFDVETAIALAEKLGVEPCFVAPAWTEVTSGNWGDRWDISIGSMDITRERMRGLYFSQPYYATPQYFFVHQDSKTASVSDLSGKRIGVCTGCVHEAYLKRTLDSPGQTIEYQVTEPQIVGFDVEPPGLEALAAGDGAKLDAFLAAEQVGVEAIGEGLPLEKLGEPVFFGYSSAAIDRGSGKDSVAFLERVTEIIEGLHAAGTLKALSLEYFGVDYATEAADFDLAAAGQAIP